MTEPIRVFVSYSGDDWESFVKPFATQLLSNGINAVVANWDVQGGQSLVKRIFEEEIPRAQAIIVVLSKSSVVKPWVLEEMDHATVQRINGQSKLIPVKIDECQVPSTFQTIKRISYYKNDDFIERTREVVDAIYGHSRKPPLGQAPAYLQQHSTTFPELSQGESQVLDVLLEDCLSHGTLEIDVYRIIEDLEASGLTLEQVNRNVSKLKARHYLRESRVGSAGLHVGTTLRTSIAVKFSRERCSNYDAIQRQIAADVASLAPNHFILFHFDDDAPEFVYRTLLQELSEMGFVNVTWFFGPGAQLTPASPFIDEWLESHT